MTSTEDLPVSALFSCRGRFSRSALRMAGVAGMLIGFCTVYSFAQQEPQPQAQQGRVIEPIPAKPEAEETRFNGVIVRGGNQQLRGTIASQAEQLRVAINNLLDDKEGKLKIPCIIQLHDGKKIEQPKYPMAVRIGSIEGQYRVTLHIHIGQAPDDALLRYHLMEMFLYERGLRQEEKIRNDDVLLVSPWLIHGMLETCELKNGRGDVRVYRAKIDYFKVLSVEEILVMTEAQRRGLLGQKPIAFRAITGSLVSALLRQKGGEEGMRKMLEDAASFKGEQENLLRKHFPGMNKSRTSLEKWTRLELAELGTARMLEALTILETEKRLDSILKLRFKNSKGELLTKGIDEYAAIIKLNPEQRFNSVSTARAELERISYRCFPTYRPIIAEYEMILRSVILGKDDNIKTRLSNIQTTRRRYVAAAKRVRDYLDWYYITQSQDLGGSFKQYQELIQAVEKETNRDKPDDAVKRYLDEMEKFYQNLPPKYKGRKGRGK